MRTNEDDNTTSHDDDTSKTTTRIRGDFHSMISLLSSLLHSSSTSNNAKYTLRQLVPIHQCVLLSSRCNNNDSNNEANGSLQNDDNDTKTNSMNINSNMQNSTATAATEQIVLFWIQYKIFHNNNNNVQNDPKSNKRTSTIKCPWENTLWNVVLPILFQEETIIDDTTGRLDEKVFYENDELMDAILDAVFAMSRSSSSSSDNAGDDHLNTFQQCLMKCLEYGSVPSNSSNNKSATATSSNDKTNSDNVVTVEILEEDDDNDNCGTMDVPTYYDWKISCHVLYRIYKFLIAIQDNNECNNCHHRMQLLYECIQSKILQGVQMGTSMISSISSGSSTLDDLKPILKPMVDYLLPILANSTTTITPTTTISAAGGEQPRVTSLLFVWKSILDPYEATRNRQTQSNLIVITTIVCSILPSLLVVLQQPEQLTEEHRRIIIDSPLLWELIYTCIHQGITMNNNIPSSWVDRGGEKTQPAARTMTEATTNSNNRSCSNAPAMNQLCRRRGIYLLRILVENESIFCNSSDNNGNHYAITSKNSRNDTRKGQQQVLLLWNKYVACYETLEMESEQHLIDQIWDTVTELFSDVFGSDDTIDTDCDYSLLLPKLSWDWLSLLLAKSLIPNNDTPVLRKLTLYRLLKGQAGIHVPCSSTLNETSALPTVVASGAVETKHGSNKNDSKNTKRKQQQQQKQDRKPENLQSLKGAPISIIPSEFMVNCIIPSFDSLASSVGWNIHVSENQQKHQFAASGNSKAIEAVDMAVLMTEFLHHYLISMIDDDNKIQSFFQNLWDSTIVCTLHRKTIVHIFQSIEKILILCNSNNNPTNITQSTLRIPITCEMLDTVAKSYQMLFSLGSLVYTYQTAMLRSLATMLEYSKTKQSSGDQPIIYPPKSLLRVLALYPIPSDTSLDRCGSSLAETNDETSWVDQNPAFVSLRKWLSLCVTDSNLPDSGRSGIHVLASTVATAFVDGMLLASDDGDNAIAIWDVKKGASDLERVTSKAIGLLCSLPTSSTTVKDDDEAASQTMTASEMLWPAIHKGLSGTAPALSTPIWPRADRVTRALLLLEIGCRLCVLSGMGNGDLIVSSKSGQIMMPPPPNIELLLSNAVTFALYHVHALMRTSNYSHNDADNSSESISSNEVTGGGSRSSDARQISSTYDRLVSQLQVLGKAYPSSVAIASSAGVVWNDSLQSLSSDGEQSDFNCVQQLSLVYAALTCVGAIDEKTDFLSSCKMILKLEFTESKNCGENQQPTRSVFQFAKWGSLSLLLPHLFDETSSDSLNYAPREDFVALLFEEAIDSVQAAPSTALVPLFKCVIITAKHSFSNTVNETDRNNSAIQHARAQSLEKVINALFGIIEDSRSSSGAMAMLDELCALIFHSDLLLDEYKQLVENNDCLTPIRNAFRRAIKMAGTQKPHISRIVLSRMCAGWLGYSNSSFDEREVGLAAIPYQADILHLLLHKEERIEESGTNQNAQSVGNEVNAVKIPKYTNETSVTRSFLLIFLSKLPDPDKGLSLCVLQDLLHPMISNALDKIQATGSVIMYGTAAYCEKMRGWQSLCVLSRFVTTSIAQDVCDKTFLALEKEMIHNQIRYFIEIFTLQFARTHPAIFCKSFVKHILRRDLSLQMISSLMIVGGNLIVGRYQDDFFRDNREGIDIKLVLAAVIPWLSSTQGFSRAIAQLLTHKLIPLAIDVSNREQCDPSSSDWYLRSVYLFLEENSEMKRLRKKQATFFHHYEADSVCTPEGVLSIPVDEGGESSPVHMIEVIKECLQCVYDEGHIEDAPTWRQKQHFDDSKPLEVNSANAHSNEIVNFQRKIIPIDALNLALESMREKKLRNAVGRKKQNLIVCATLIDKIPNLGGLTRTSEIFAADRLIVPDIRLTKMDNFKSLTVGAHEWIDIEECKEENLLGWLGDRKEEGYLIVGLEQTSSSQSLLEYKFSNQPTVLLLGKEKEGIPVELLHVVDECIEIPQLGIIRSLNVHVAAALCIWEHRKQRWND